MNVYDETKTRLLAGGFSEESSDSLASLLALHYPEHAEYLLGSHNE